MMTTFEVSIDVPVPVMNCRSSCQVEEYFAVLEQLQIIYLVVQVRRWKSADSSV